MSPRIIPPNPPIRTPTSELQVYDLFEAQEELADWIVIHSSGHQGEHTFREIDFLALVPGYGILCIEVKGGGFYVRDGQWHRWRDQVPIEAPARQAEQAMYALQKSLRERYGAGSAIGQTPAECLVIFPDADWPDGVRRPRASVIDRTDIDDRNFYAKVMQSVLRLRPRTGSRSNLPPTTEREIADLRQFLAPDFNMAPRQGNRHEGRRPSDPYSKTPEPCLMFCDGTHDRVLSTA